MFDWVMKRPVICINFKIWVWYLNNADAKQVYYFKNEDNNNRNVFQNWFRVSILCMTIAYQKI